MPPINRLYTELKPRDFEVLLVNFREDPAHVKRVAQERGYVAPVLLDRSGDTTGRLYGVFGPPTFYLIDRAGSWAAPSARATGAHRRRAGSCWGCPKESPN